jgi:hypothetical protein
MLNAVEWRLGTGEHFGIARVFVVAAEAVEAERSLRLAQTRVGQLVEDTSQIVEEVDGYLASLGIDQCPALLEHLDDLDPKVLGLDWNDIRHRRWIMNLLQWLHNYQTSALSPPLGQAGPARITRKIGPLSQGHGGCG